MKSTFNSKGVLYVAGGLAIAAGIGVILAARNVMPYSDLDWIVGNESEEETLDAVTEQFDNE